MLIFRNLFSGSLRLHPCAVSSASDHSRPPGPQTDPTHWKANGLDFDLTHNELALIENNIETKNVDASLLNYKGEAYLLLADAVSNKKGMQNDVRQLKSKAKEQFKGALDRDPGYEKAKANLSRTVLMLPSSI